MKTWEMIKERTENPDKEFKQKDNRYWWGEIHELVRNKRFLEQEWEEVKKPVTWKEAFEAGLKGKRIKPKGQHLTYPDYESLHFALSYLSERPSYLESLMLDKWYIED